MLSRGKFLIKCISIGLISVLFYTKAKAQCYGFGHLKEFNLAPNLDSNCDSIAIDTSAKNLKITFYLYLGNEDYVFTKSGKLESYPYRLLTYEVIDTTVLIMKDTTLKSKIRYYYDPYRYSRPLGEKYDNYERKIYKTNYFGINDTSYFDDTLEFYYPIYSGKEIESLLFIFNSGNFRSNTNSICLYNLLNNKQLKLCHCIHNVSNPTLSSLEYIKKMNKKNYFFAVFQGALEYYFYILII